MRLEIDTIWPRSPTLLATGTQVRQAARVMDMWMRMMKLCFGRLDHDGYGHLPPRLRVRHSALLHYSRGR